MLDALRALWRGMSGRCPVCGMGQLFHSYYGLIEGCAQCGRRYEGMGNQSAGAIGITLTLTTMLGFIGSFLIVFLSPTNLGWKVFTMFLGLAVFHALFYRIARGLWIGLLAITGAQEEDTRRDEFLL